MDAKHTSKSSILTVRIKIYHSNKMMTLDGIPINDRGKRAAHGGTPGPEYDEVAGWLTASEIFGITLNEFRKQCKNQGTGRTDAMERVAESRNQSRSGTVRILKPLARQ
jgi:hypothetical protein